MSWHLTEHLSALGSQQHVSVDLQAGLFKCPVGGKCSVYLSVLVSPALVCWTSG